MGSQSLNPSYPIARIVITGQKPSAECRGPARVGRKSRRLFASAFRRMHRALTEGTIAFQPCIRKRIAPWKARLRHKHHLVTSITVDYGDSLLITLIDGTPINLRFNGHCTGWLNVRSVGAMRSLIAPYETAFDFRNLQNLQGSDHVLRLTAMICRSPLMMKPFALSLSKGIWRGASTRLS